MAENVSDAFRSLPMKDLIGQPFSAACSANILLATAMYDYVIKVAYEKGDESAKTTKVLEFKLDQPYTNPEGVISTLPIDVKAPFLGLVPIPSLLIDNVTVDFTMKVAATEQDTTKVGIDTNFGMTGKSWNFSGSVSASNERIRTSNQEATYVVHVAANQQPQTEGLSKLMDIMASCIAPMGGGK
jgi:hypothetical protein